MCFFSHVILGDINGEIHVISIQYIQFNQVEKFTNLGEFFIIDNDCTLDMINIDRQA